MADDLKPPSNSPMLLLVTPNDAELLKVIGEVAVLHGHLDYLLRMTIKSLDEVSIKEALDDTDFVMSGRLRGLIVKAAKRKLGEGPALAQLGALLEQCRQASKKRNNLLHGLWARVLDGDFVILTYNDNDEREWRPIPTLAQLNDLAVELRTLANALNYARFEGFLKDAMEAGKKTSTG